MMRQIVSLDVPERVVYKLGVMVFNCLHDQAPLYLAELCQPVEGVASRQHLRSAARQFLVVYHATSSAPMADGFSVWLVRRSGIPCWTACGIWLLAGTVLHNLWRRFCSQRTYASGALVSHFLDRFSPWRYACLVRFADFVNLLPLLVNACSCTRL